MALSAIADSFSITSKEQQQMLNEADDWIDNMPDGLQDRLSDAVNHSLHGFFSEIEYFRNINDTTGIGRYAVTVRDIPVGKDLSLPLRLYVPKLRKSSESLPLLVYFHGGGWTLGSLNSSDRFCRALASEGNVMVISVAYPLAPEHTYPSAISPSTSAMDYISAHATEWGADRNRISLGGDGAGGNVALEVYENLPSAFKVCSLVLYYPLLKASGSLDADMKKRYGRGYGLDSRLWESFITAYRGEDLKLNKTLPPTLIITSGRDIIINEVKAFESHHKVEIVEFSGAIHGFISDGQQKTAFKKAVEFTDSFISDNQHMPSRL